MILGAGLERGALTPAVHSMMVLMALAPTAMTTPILQILGDPIAGGPPRQDSAP